VPAAMSPWRRWMERPQSLWFRKLLLQIHLWTGIAVGSYVIVVSLSGSAIVLRRELGPPARKHVLTSTAGRKQLSAAEIEWRAQRTYPSRQILSVIEPQAADRPYAVILGMGSSRVERLFDPYTGTDLGDPHLLVDRAFNWLTNLHDNLLFGLTGRTLNGIGSLLLVLLSGTGAVIWWPGIQNWRRSTRMNWRARPARLNWDLHSAVGFWCYLFVLVWGISGICLCFPGVLDFLLNNQVRLWITRLHFGRFNAVTEVIWTVVGLAPAFLAITGVFMWWNRVLSKKVRRFRDRNADAATARAL
jgi:uncharacterized iron-regulated membrane protein